MDSFITGTDRERLQAKLTPGEELLWCSKPEISVTQGFNHVLGGLLLIGFGCLPLAAGVDPEAATWAVLLFYSFCAIFILPGLALLFVAAPQHIRHERQQVYAITNKRAFVLKHNGKLKEYPLEPYMVQEVRYRGERTGDIILGYEARQAKYGTYMEGVGFLHCREVEAALNLLQGQLNSKALLSSKSPEEIRREREQEDLRNAEPEDFTALVTDMSVFSAIALGCLGVLLYKGLHLPALAGFILGSFISLRNIPKLRSALRGRKLKKKIPLNHHGQLHHRR